MIEFIKSLTAKPVAPTVVTARKDIPSILEPFKKIIEELRTLTTSNMNMVETNEQIIKSLEVENKQKTAEAGTASEIAAKIEAIIT
jgi:hypothetical protein